MADKKFVYQKRYNPDDPKDARELLELLEEDDDVDVLTLLEGNNSDIEGNGSDESDLEDSSPIKPRLRVGADIVRPADIENNEDYLDLDEDNDLLSNGNATLLQGNDGVNSQDDPNQYDEISYTKKSDIQWRRRQYTPPLFEWSASEREEETTILAPINYFNRYFSESFFEDAATKTNIYALQESIKNFRPTDKGEIKTLIGLHMIMGCLKFPRVRMYWDTTLHVDLFVNSMTRTRFFQLRTCLHVVNNLEKPDNCQDKMFKVRPVFDLVRKRCLELSLEQELSVDEQMVPFRGNLAIKQYVKGKPHPWGVKIFVLCGRSGIAYDFVIYQGSTTEIDDDSQKKFGAGAACVLHLAMRITSKNHQLYFDNYFSTYNLFEILLERNIYAAGTVRVNRFQNPPLVSDKEANKKPRGYYDEVVSRDGKVTMCKWVDNRTVVLASNFVGGGTPDVVKRWDKKEKKYVDIERPEVVRLYNHSMGGVDKMDQLLGFYRIYIRSKKWSLRMFFHAIDMAVVNSWLEYKADAEKLQIANKEVLDLLHFKMRVAEALVVMGKPANGRKRGRPRSSVPEEPPAKKNKNRKEFRPPLEIRTDLTDHMPNFDDKKEATRCKNKSCKGKTHIMCEKCKIHLCLVKNRNCFKNFHCGNE